MKKRTMLFSAVLVVAAVFLVAGLYAGTQIQDVVKMENKAYATHTKGIAEFSHKKHATDYKAGCGECHHDKDAKPLTSLKEGDDVQGCIECHKLTEPKPKGKKLSKSEKLKYHHEAIHENCKGCHKAFNKKNKTKAAPTTCAKCHPKTK